MARYDDACRHDPDVDGMDLYRWAGTVALAVFDDLGHVEVAMRSAMARELAARYGLRWYEDKSILDSETFALIEQAKERTRLDSLPDDPALRHGKLVASLMFGFWVKLLGRGGFMTTEAAVERRIYDTVIWKKAVRRAFPHVGDVERQRVETAARYCQALRNRIAHHEHIIWGVPIAGSKSADGAALRLSLARAHEAVVQLAGFMDPELAAWLAQYSEVSTRLAACPIYEGELFLTDQD